MKRAMVPRVLRPTVSILLIACSAGGTALAQQSASYSMKEFILNSGGTPVNGAVLSSASYLIALESIGEGVIATGRSSTSFQMDVGFVGVYPPPTEVKNVRFANKTSIGWLPELSVGTYSVYRDSVTTLPGNFGVCLQSSIPIAATSDATDPPNGTGRFYLVTARNRLGEEGTKGFRSSGAERPNPAPCP